MGVNVCVQKTIVMLNVYDREQPNRNSPVPHKTMYFNGSVAAPPGKNTVILCIALLQRILFEVQYFMDTGDWILYIPCMEIKMYIREKITRKGTHETRLFLLHNILC